MMISIQRFLLLGLLGILLLSFIVIFLFNRYQTVVEVGELYDTQLAQTSRILQGFFDKPINEIDLDRLNNALLSATENYNNNELRNDEGHEYERKFAIQVWDEEKNLLIKSPAAPMYTIANFHDGYSNKKFDHFDWTIFTHHITKNGYWIVVAERADVREDIIDELTLSSLLGPIAGMIILAFGVVLVVTKGLNPLIHLSQQIRERHIDKLEPLVLDRAPKELKPLVESINILMQRVSQDVERERQFLGNIAHELRTPLAAMKLNAQNGLNTKDSHNIHNALIKIVHGVDRSTRLIEQLLTLARLEPHALEAQELCSLGDIAQEVVSAINSQQYLKYIPNIKCDESLFSTKIWGYPLLLHVLFRNLIENACRYTSEGKKVYIFTEQNSAEKIMLHIIDEGTGVSELQLQSLGKRFFRERPADRMGNGLGLSIVSRIVELHNAELHFSNLSPQGLKVSIVFPAQSNL